jgi:hypothetical protein
MSCANVMHECHARIGDNKSGGRRFVSRELLRSQLMDIFSTFYKTMINIYFMISLMSCLESKSTFLPIFLVRKHLQINDQWYSVRARVKMWPMLCEKLTSKSTKGPFYVHTWNLIRAYTTSLLLYLCRYVHTFSYLDVHMRMCGHWSPVFVALEMNSKRFLSCLGAILSYFPCQLTAHNV